MPESAEEWRPIPSWEGLYEASSLGRIKSLPRTVHRRNRWGGEHDCHYGERILKPFRNADAGGYLILHLSDEDGRHTHSIHALVCAAFHGPRPDGKHAAHGNGNPQDNRLGNLRWATPKENEADKVSHGRVNQGERNGACNINASDVVYIRRSIANGTSRKLLAQQLYLSASQIGAISTRKKWKHVA